MYYEKKYIKFDSKYRLLISNNLEFSKSIYLKTTETINAFFVLLNLGDKINPIIEGHILHLDISSEILDSSKFRNIIRSARYNCYLNKLNSSIVGTTHSGNLFYINKFGKFQLPIILEVPPITRINYYWWENNNVNDGVMKILNILRSSYIGYESNNLPNGGIEFLFRLPDKFDITSLYPKIIEVRNACNASSWRFKMEYCGFKSWTTLKIYRFFADIDRPSKIKYYENASIKCVY